MGLSHVMLGCVQQVSLCRIRCLSKGQIQAVVQASLALFCRGEAVGGCSDQGLVVKR